MQLPVAPQYYLDLKTACPATDEWKQRGWERPHSSVSERQGEKEKNRPIMRKKVAHFLVDFATDCC